MAETPVTSRAIYNESSDPYKRLQSSCELVVSAPGTYFLAGEKALRLESNPPATCGKVPRRVYVGLRPKSAAAAPRISLAESTVFIQEDEQPPKKTERYGASESLSAALSVAVLAYEVIVGQPLARHFEIEVLSEWQGDYGLGWSGAFATALAGSLLHHAGKVDSLTFPASDEALRSSSTFRKIMALAWCIETVFHNGRCSGSAPCGSLLPSGLPYLYQIIGNDKVAMPQLWDSNADEATISAARSNRANYKRVHDQIAYSVTFTLKDRNRSEREIANDLFSTRDVLIVHSNVPKQTGVQARREHSQSWINQQLDCKHKHYPALADNCKVIATAILEIISAVVEHSGNKVDRRWDDLCNLVTRTHGLLTALGFSFPVGDEIIGRLLSSFCDTGPQTSIGAKVTGAGGGGSILVTLRSATPEKRVRLLNAVRAIRDDHTARHEHWPKSKICVLYSAHRDGIEEAGLLEGIEWLED